MINAISIKIQGDFDIEVDKLMLKFIWKCKEPERAKTILKKEKEGKNGLHYMISRLVKLYYSRQCDTGMRIDL